MSLTTRPAPATAPPAHRGPDSPAQLARNRRRRLRMLAVAGRRPGWLGYAFLGAVLLVSVLPLYWSFLVASGDASSARDPNLSWFPGAHFIENALAAINSRPSTSGRRSATRSSSRRPCRHPSCSSPPSPATPSRN